METGKGFLTLCKASHPAPLCSCRSPCRWPWCLALHCVLFWGSFGIRVAGDFKAWEALTRPGSDSNRRRGREITVLEKALRLGSRHPCLWVEPVSDA